MNVYIVTFLAKTPCILVGEC